MVKIVFTIQVFNTHDTSVKTHKEYTALVMTKILYQSIEKWIDSGYKKKKQSKKW